MEDILTLFLEGLERGDWAVSAYPLGRPRSDIVVFRSKIRLRKIREKKLDFEKFHEKTWT